DAAQIHDGNVVTDIAHDAEVMRNEKKCQIKFVPQLIEQVHYLRLHRYVQCRYLLVGDQQLCTVHERTSNAGALALTARQAVRAAIEKAQRKSVLIGYLFDMSLLFGWFAQAMHLDDFLQRLPDGQARIERGDRLLEDHLHAAPELLRFGLVKL